MNRAILISLLALAFLSFRDDPKELVLREYRTFPHPEIFMEFDRNGIEYWEPRVTLLCIETRDGKEKFFVRAAQTMEDSAMMIRTVEPVDRQFRRK